MPAPDSRDGAERATAVASFRYFEVGKMGRGTDNPFVQQLFPERGVEFSEDGVQVIDAEKAVHFGQLTDKLLPVSLRQTAHYIEFAYSVFFFRLNPLQDGIHRFFPGIVDETTGVYNHHLSIGPAIMDR